MAQQGRNDTHFLLIARRKIADILFLTHNLARHEALEERQALSDSFLSKAVYLADKLEILLGRKEVY